MTSNIAVFDLFDSEEPSDLKTSFIPSNSIPRQGELKNDNSNKNNHIKETNDLFKSFQSSENLASTSFFNANQSMQTGFQEVQSFHDMNRTTNSVTPPSQPDLTRYFDDNDDNDSFNIGGDMADQSNMNIINDKTEVKFNHSNEATESPNVISQDSVSSSDSIFVHKNDDYRPDTISHNETKASDLILNILNKIEKFELNKKDLNKNQSSSNKSAAEIKLEQSQLMIDNLNNKISRLEENNRTVTLEKQKLQDEIAIIRKELSNKDEYMKQLQNEIQELNKTINNLQQNLENEGSKSPKSSTPLTEESLIPVFPPSKPRSIKKNESKQIDVKTDQLSVESNEEVQNLSESVDNEIIENSPKEVFELENITESNSDTIEKTSEDNVETIPKEDVSSSLDENKVDSDFDTKDSSEVIYNENNETNNDISSNTEEITGENNIEETGTVELQEDTSEPEVSESNIMGQEEEQTTENTSSTDESPVSKENTEETENTLKPTPENTAGPIFMSYNPSNQPVQPLFISSPFGYSPQVSKETKKENSDSDGKTKKRVSRFAGGTRGRRLAQPET